MLLKKNFEREQLRRIIFFIPNALTTVNLFFGFYSILASIEGNFVLAAIAIIVSGSFDYLDGKVARATNTTSKFGIEYDSISDLISFGLAPSLLIYLWALKPIGYLGFLGSFFFIFCGALRLAKFNSYPNMKNKFFFLGLPITAAAGMLASTVLFFFKLRIDILSNCYIVLLMLNVLSFLMISSFKYISFGKNELFRKINLNLLWMFFIFICVIFHPSVSLFIFGLFYVFFAPIYFMLNNKDNFKRSNNLD